MPTMQLALALTVIASAGDAANPSTTGLNRFCPSRPATFNHGEQHSERFRVGQPMVLSNGNQARCL
jgi:hypothetical protein